MVEHAIAQWTRRRRLRAAVVPAAIGPYTRVMTTSTVVYERAAWEHGDYWWSTTPCCSREIRLHYAYARYKARLERAMETPGIDQTPRTVTSGSGGPSGAGPAAPAGTCCSTTPSPATWGHAAARRSSRQNHSWPGGAPPERLGCRALYAGRDDGAIARRVFLHSPKRNYCTPNGNRPWASGWVVQGASHVTPPGDRCRASPRPPFVVPNGMQGGCLPPFPQKELLHP